MFFVKHVDGECDPVVRCHICATNIREMGKAMVVYERTMEEGQTARVACVHRDGCLPKAIVLMFNDYGDPHTISLQDFFERLRLGATVNC
jgi:hypothetical protein